MTEKRISKEVDSWRNKKTSSKERVQRQETGAVQFQTSEPFISLENRKGGLLKTRFSCRFSCKLESNMRFSPFPEGNRSHETARL